MTQKCVIFDMDGTLCDVSSIVWLLDPEQNKGKKNFPKFHTQSEFCPPVEWVAECARNTNVPNVIVTAREFDYYGPTINFLRTHDIPWDAIYMRRSKDYRPDFVVKEEILDKILQDEYNPVLAFDDNPNVIALWQKKGIPVIRVPRDDWE